MTSKLNLALPYISTEKRRMSRQKVASLKFNVRVHQIDDIGKECLETGKYLTLNGYKDCPPGLSYHDSTSKCNTGLYVHSWNHVELNEPLRYERNDQGDMRSVRCFDKDSSGHCITHTGPWVRNGCSLQPYANGNERPFHKPVPDRTVVAMVCADCEIITSGFPKDATLKCACPGYADTKSNSLLGKMDSSSQSYPTQEHKIAVQPNFSHLDPIDNQQNLVKESHDRSMLTKMRPFKQCDPRWACYPYHGHANLSTCNTTVCGVSNNICISGCGITSLAMVLTFHGFDYITPPHIADHLVAKGFRDDLSDIKGATCNGVSHTAICAVAKMFNMTCDITKSFALLNYWLNEHKPYDDYSAPVIGHVRHKLGYSC